MLNTNNKQKEAEAKRIAEETAAAKADAEKMKSMELVFSIEVGANGKAFGSISGKEIAEELSKKGIVVDKKAVVLNSAIKMIGVYDVEVKLYKGVSGKVKVNVQAK